jgi:hypothetical protein
MAKGENHGQEGTQGHVCESADEGQRIGVYKLYEVKVVRKNQRLESQ